MVDDCWSRPHQLHPSTVFSKRPRPDYELSPAGLPSAHEMHNYIARDEERHEPYTLKDTKSIASAYDYYLQNGHMPPFSSGEGSTYSKLIGVDEQVVYTPDDPVSVSNPRDVPQDLLDVKHPVDAPASDILPLPPDATNTLYIEGLPSHSTRREVAHIFRPFVGYKEVRLVSKPSRYPGRDPLILCFVDFASPACAATALSAIQGYKFDEHDPDSAYLRLQFSKHPGPRSGGSRRHGRMMQITGS